MGLSLINKTPVSRLKGEMDKLKDEQESTITKERVKFSKEIKVRFSVLQFVTDFYNGDE